LTSIQKSGVEVLKPKPRYTKPSVGSSHFSSSRPNSASVGSDLNFDSTTNIRNAIFDEWKLQAQKRIKQTQLEKKKIEQELEEKKRKVFQ